MKKFVYFSQEIVKAFLSSKVWFSVALIVFGVSVVAYIFMIVTEASPLILLEI